MRSRTPQEVQRARYPRASLGIGNLPAAGQVMAVGPRACRKLQPLPAAHQIMKAQPAAGQTGGKGEGKHQGATNPIAEAPAAQVPRRCWPAIGEGPVPWAA